MHHAPRFSAIVLLLGIASGACHSSTDPEFLPSAVAGVYTLDSVSGRGPVSGSFILTEDGLAVRRVKYAPSVAGSTEFVAIGTFQLPPGAITFALREDNGNSSSIWSVRGERGVWRFNIRYGDPADGPDIIESYSRKF